LAGALGNPGGMGRFIRELLRELGVRDDIEMVVAAPPGTEDELDSIGCTNIVDVVTGRGSSALSRGLWDRRRTGRLLEDRGVDVIHGTKHLIPVTSLPTVLTVHDVMTITWRRQFGIVKRLLLPAQFRASLRDATVLVAVSEATAERLALLDASFAPKTVVVPNGISAELLGVQARPLADAPRGRFALVVGDLSPRKNVKMLLDIWEEVARRTDGLTLVAVGPEGWRSAGTRRRIDMLAERGLVRWVRNVPDAAMLLAPTIEEGYGLPVVEALALGTPVIASTDAALMEVAQGRARHLAPDDRGAWTDAIVAAASEPREPPAPPVLATWSEHAARTVKAYHLAIEYGRAE
jgi:glycosyltransferase involved in cell wall biosynthesis